MSLRGFAIHQSSLLLLTLALLSAFSGALHADDSQQPLQHWEYRWGDSPIDADGTPLWLHRDTIDWQSTASPSNPSGRGNHQHLWLRTTLPAGEWDDPVLYITSMNLIGQAYLNGELIYQYGEFDEQGRGDFAGWPWHMIDLPESAAGQTLTFRLYSDYTSIGLWGEVKVMERIDVLKQVIHSSAKDLGVSAVVSVMAVLATIFAILGPDRRGFTAIALFGYASGLMLLAETPARQLIADGPLAWDTLRAASYYTLPIALGLLLSHWLEGATKRWINRLWILHLAYLTIAIGCVQLGLISLSITFPAFDLLLAITLPLMLLLALFRFRWLNLEQRLLVISFTFFASLLLADMAVAHGFVAWRSVPLSYGALAFLLAIAAIFLWHYRRTQQQLAVVNETLELQVATRTAELDQLVKELEGLSFKDHLTGLHNRRHFHMVFDHECRRAKQMGSRLTLLMLDVDHFKRINDHFGHEAGDAVLVEIASFLRQHFRGMDIVCRFGGEEFIALLPTTCAASAYGRANDLLISMSQKSLVFNSTPLGHITLSCGVATYPDHTQDPQQLLRLADEALYRAKHAGRNRCVVANEPLEKPQAPFGREQPQ
ncbi:MAG: GGDEF domain-containing protein [Halomonas sp.]|nr:GGDEF domain-containing protein [Halomonas sp.]TVP46179.1 MAG: GGDEF domain-containing protein [Halomonas sp.]